MKYTLSGEGAGSIFTIDQITGDIHALVGLDRSVFFRNKTSSKTLHQKCSLKFLMVELAPNKHMCIVVSAKKKMHHRTTKHIPLPCIYVVLDLLGIQFSYMYILGHPQTSASVLRQNSIILQS